MRDARELDEIVLDHGEHATFEDGHCLMEVVAWFAGQPHSDAPPCVSPVLRKFGIELNDRWGDEPRQALKPLIPLLVGTAGDGQDEARGYMALDWLIRTYTPAALDLAGCTDEAQELRGLRRVVDLVSARAARPAVYAGKAAARVKRDQAWTKIRAAGAAWAAWAAEAAGAAGAAEAAEAAGAAWADIEQIKAKAREIGAGAVKPTADAMAASVLDLFRSMCTLGRES